MGTGVGLGYELPTVSIVLISSGFQCKTSLWRVYRMSSSSSTPTPKQTYCCLGECYMASATPGAFLIISVWTKFQSLEILSDTF